MPKKKIVILGAGLAGLSTAWHLQREGIDCLIFEKEPEVGGMCRSKQIEDFIFDYDGHLLHFKHRYTFKLIKRLLHNNLIKHQRNAWVYSFGKYVRYPFQANLYGLPAAIIKECLLGLIKVSNNGNPEQKKDENFLSWIGHNFGKGIANQFMIPYNKKFWTIPPEKLTCDWLDGFIPIPPLERVIEGALEDNQNQIGYNASFWYPKKGGIVQLPLVLAREIKNVYVNSEVVELNVRDKEIRLASGHRERYDFLISTIPLPRIPFLVKNMPRQLEASFKQLRWNSIFNLNLGIERKDFLGRHWVYFPQKEICFFRVGFPQSFSSALSPHDKSSLYAEVSYSKFKPIDKKQIIPDIVKDLVKIGILDNNDRIFVKDINDIEYGYPIYDRYYNQARENILKFLNKFNIATCGRFGSWRYMSMEDVILNGKQTAEWLICLVGRG